MEYCTYLTIYLGNKLPTFYIGRSKVTNIKNGYRGSVSSKLYKKIWLEELSQNPHLFETKILTIHKTQKEAADKEEFFHKKLQVHKNTLYINQATAHGTFYADIKGNKNPWYGKSRTGNLNPMFGKKHKKISLEKMSVSGKGKHSHPRPEACKEATRLLQLGKSYEERFGVEYAEEIKSKLRKPKSTEHIQKMKENPYHANRPKLKCPHCQKEASVGNLKRWHGDNCKLFKIFSDPL